MRLITLLTIILVSLAGCSETTSESSVNPRKLTPVNQNCPIMGGAVTEDSETVDFNGKVVGFCCQGCDADWKALSDQEKTEQLATAIEI